MLAREQLDQVQLLAPFEGRQFRPVRPLPLFGVLGIGVGGLVLIPSLFVYLEEPGELTSEPVARSR